MTPSSPGTRAPARGPASSSASTSGEALLLAIKEALRAFRDQTKWQVLMRNGMMRDFSWNASAREYSRIYERVRQLQPTTTLTQRIQNVAVS